jgi:hypothetical protein
VNFNCVVQFAAGFANAGKGTSVAVGPGIAANPSFFFDGAFDNVYYASTNGTAGNLYVTGSANTPGGQLYQIAITSTGAIDTTAPTSLGAISSGVTMFASPITEFCANGTSNCALQTASGCTNGNGANANKITCTTADFTSAADLNATIVGTNIPANATITTVTSTTVIKISTPASGDPGTVTIGVTTSGHDYIFLSAYEGHATGCTATAGHGCVLAYEVSTPPTANSTTFTATPQAYLDENYGSTFSCFVTGAIVVDNAISTEVGASEIYFLGLDGTSTNLCGSGATPTGGHLLGTQGAQ